MTLLWLQGHSNEKNTVNIHRLESLGMPIKRYGGLLISIMVDRMRKEITTPIAGKINQKNCSIDKISEIIRNAE